MRRTRSRPAVRGLSLVTALLALAACGGGGKSVNLGGSSGSAGGGGSQLVAAIAGEPDKLDPQNSSAYFTFEVLENVFDTLVEPDVNLEMKPALATSWTTAPDQLSWTFQLRSGVKFHNGDPFTADDVVYSYRRIIDKKLSNAYRFESVKQITAVNPTTVRIDLSRPTPNLLENIGSFKGMAIVDRRNAESGEIDKNPVGTGPFRFTSQRSGDSIVLSRNPDYWGGAPKLGSLKFIYVSEPGTALADLRSGEAQWTDNLPASQVKSLSSGSDPVVKHVPSTDYWYLTLNEAHKPFNDPRVRQAFAYAIDRDAIAQAARYGAATVNQTAIPAGNPWYSDYHPYTTDQAKARSLLAEAGVTGLKVDFMVTTQYPETVAAAQVMKDELSKVGITLNIRTLDFTAWLADEGKGSYDGFMLSWLGNIDPDDFYYGQHHTGAPNNYQKYSNPATDALLDQARSTTDHNARKGLYDQAVKHIVDDASYIYLYNSDGIAGWTTKVSGYTVRPDRAVRFRDVSLG